MKGLRKITAALALLLIPVLVFVTGCSPSGKKVEMTDYFNTVSYIAAYAEEDALLAAAEEVQAVFEQIESAVSISSKTSDIARFNETAGGETLEISRITYDLLETALDLYEYTEGAYNPAVGRLVDLWGLSPRFNSNDYAPTLPYDREPNTIPDGKYIDAFLGLTNFGDIKLTQNNGKYYATKPDSSVSVDDTVYYMTIDLGGIAKGYAADEAADILKQHGITQSYVSVGTSSLRLLESKKNNWTVTLRSPRQDGNYAEVYVNNTAASTSGDYERYFTVDSKRYCHIISPVSGAPIDNEMVTVSLFGRTAAEGDALTTALSVMGRDDAIKFINANLTDCRVCFVWYNVETDKYEFITNMESGYELRDENIKLHSKAKDGKITYVA